MNEEKDSYLNEHLDWKIFHFLNKLELNAQKISLIPAKNSEWIDCRRASDSEFERVDHNDC